MVALNMLVQRLRGECVGVVGLSGYIHAEWVVIAEKI